MICQRSLLAIAVLISFFLGACLRRAEAQELTWGTGGQGGSGSWDTSTADWWNGSQNVAWPVNGNADFVGTSGTVSVNLVSVSSITFDTPGYVIENGFIEDAGVLTITTNANATISSVLFPLSPSAMLVKTGTATLTYSGDNSLSSVQINQGEFDAVGVFSLDAANVSLANAPGVILTLDGGNASMESLSGGGAGGGIVEPGTSSVSITLYNGGSFGGVLQDSGTNQLSLELAAGNQTETLTGANTYSGATTISSGTIVLAGNGSALNSTLTIYSGAALVLDNSTVANASRVSGTATLTLSGGQIMMLGNGSVPVTEALGALNFSSASSVGTSQPGAAATLLTFAGATRNGMATLSISGSGVVISGVSDGATGIVDPYITAGNDWAVADTNGRISALADYASSFAGGSESDHVKITTSGTTALPAATTRASLNLQSNGTPLVLDLGIGQSLGVTSGGILSSGTGTSTIENGSLFTTEPEWVITANNNLTISSPIVENGSATDLTKSGPGILTLSGSNTYAGTTTIDQGTLFVTSDSNLGAGSTIQFSGGTLEAGASFSSSKNISSNTPEAGVIDTNGFDVTLSGSNNGSINKTGAGTLTLTSPNTGITKVSQGTLALPDTTSGNAIVQGGTLLTSGTLATLELLGNSTLDLGGAAASELVTEFFEAFRPGSALTVDFGIGRSQSDLWTIDFFGPLNPGTFLFDFANLGGVTTGVNYPLIEYPEPLGISASAFEFAPDMAAAGWAGTISASGTQVSVDFSSVPSSVPEPGAVALLAIAALGALPRLCRTARRR